MKRRELDQLRTSLIKPLGLHDIGIAAVTGVEVREQVLTLTLMGTRFEVPIFVFEKFDVEHIAERVKKAYFFAEK